MENTKKLVHGFIMENKEKKARIKCTPSYRKQWEKMGFIAIYEGNIDITEWSAPVSDEEIKELGFDIAE